MKKKKRKRPQKILCFYKLPGKHSRMSDKIPGFIKSQEKFLEVQKKTANYLK